MGRLEALKRYACLLLLLASGSEASRPADVRALSQYQHQKWTYQDGAPNPISSIAQTSDGFLWLGTQSGLFRFDGVTFERVSVPGRDDTKEDQVSDLRTTRSGDLWVGFVAGKTAMLPAGKSQFVDAGNLEGSPAFGEEADGTVVAVTYRVTTLSEFRQGRWVKVEGFNQGPMANISLPVTDSHGTLWIAAGRRVLIRRRSARSFETTPEITDSNSRLAVDKAGRVWLADGRGGIRRLPDYAAMKSLPPPPAMQDGGPPDTFSLFFDRRGSLWGLEGAKGIFRIAHPLPDAWAGDRAPDQVAEWFSSKEGLSSSVARAIFEDREGNVWVGTTSGLDRFRQANVVRDLAIPADSPFGYFAKAFEDGSVLFGDSDTVYRAMPGGAPQPIMRGVNNPNAACQARDGSAWVAAHDALYHVVAGQAVRVPRPASLQDVFDCAWDTNGALWFLDTRSHLYRFADGKWSIFDVRALGMFGSISADTRNGLLLSTTTGLYHFTGGRSRRLSAIANIPIGRVHVIYQGKQEVLLGGAAGLARIHNGRIEALPGSNIWARSIDGIAQSPNDETWIQTPSKLLRLSTSQMDAAFSDPTIQAKPTVFDARDGLRSLDGSYSINSLARGGDSRIWITTDNSFQRIDADHLIRNFTAPSVIVKSVQSSGMFFPATGSIALPEGSNSVQIDYTATSLSIPDRVRFKYRLVGLDSHWVDAANRRQAFFTNLAPGRYSFELAAANDDGVWSVAPASQRIIVPAMFWQTRAFIGLCLIILGGLLWLAYTFRLRTLTARLRDRLQARSLERERIARDLHDTLLQGVQGLIFKLQAITDAIPSGQPIRGVMSDALDEADELLIEARDRVKDLRSTATAESLLGSLTATALRTLPAYDITAKIEIKGVERPLSEAVQQEIERINGEALSNVARHSMARTVAIRVTFRPRKLEISWADDGRGIEPSILEAGGKDGHFGLRGMQERARTVGGALAVSSTPGEGTTIRLSVPATRAYVRHSDWKSFLGR